MCPQKERAIFLYKHQMLFLSFSFWFVCVFFLMINKLCNWKKNKSGIWYDILVNVFNKFEGNITRNKLITKFYINRSMKVNSYELDFLSFHFSSQPNKLVFNSFTFHPSNQTCWGGKKNFFYPPTFPPPTKRSQKCK